MRADFRLGTGLFESTETLPYSLRLGSLQREGMGRCTYDFAIVNREGVCTYGFAIVNMEIHGTYRRRIVSPAPLWLAWKVLLGLGGSTPPWFRKACALPRSSRATSPNLCEGIRKENRITLVKLVAGYGRVLSSLC